jgi:hypothetical protein
MARSPRYSENLIYFYLSSYWILPKRFRYYFSASFAGSITLLTSWSIIGLLEIIFEKFPLIDFLMVFVPILPVWLRLPVSARCTLFTFELLMTYRLGFLLIGVFFTSSCSFRGAKRDDLILLDWPCTTFCIPEPMMEIGSGRKSNWWTWRTTSEVKVFLDVGVKVISTLSVSSAGTIPFSGLILISWHSFW